MIVEARNFGSNLDAEKHFLIESVMAGPIITEFGDDTYYPQVYLAGNSLLVVVGNKAFVSTIFNQVTGLFGIKVKLL